MSIFDLVADYLRGLGWNEIWPYQFGNHNMTIEVSKAYCTSSNTNNGHIAVCFAEIDKESGRTIRSTYWYDVTNPNFLEELKTDVERHLNESR